MITIKLKEDSGIEETEEVKVWLQKVSEILCKHIEEQDLFFDAYINHVGNSRNELLDGLPFKEV